MSRIRGVLFDKDGTLIDFQKTWFAIADALALETAGGDRAEADRLLEVGGYDFAQGRFRADSVIAAGTNAEIVALWHPGLDGDARDALIRDVDSRTAELGAARAVPLPGMAEALAELHGRGLKIGLCTNDSTRGAEKTLAALGVAPLFDAIYGYDAVANPKPAPDALHAFCARCGLEPSEVAMVGDNGHDLVMARAGGAGLAVGVLSGTGTRETLAPLADMLLSSVAELPGLLPGTAEL